MRDNVFQDDSALSVPFVNRVMARNRFDKLNQYLQLNNNLNFVPDRQPKSQQALQSVSFPRCGHEVLTGRVSPKQNLSVDEATVGLKGQLWLKHYLLMQPVKCGIKIWEFADFSNGYVCNLQVYTGKQDGGVTEHGLGYRVVRVFHKYHVFCDNFFTLIPLACNLLREQTYLCGMIRSNRHSMPAGLLMKNAKVKALRKVESRFRRCGNLVASVWKDAKLVSFLSKLNPVGDDHVNRKQQDGSIIEVPPVPTAVSYNENMGGVDLNDQHRKHYSVGHKSRKWWRYLLWFLIDVSIVNAHILEKEALNHLSCSD